MKSLLLAAAIVAVLSAPACTSTKTDAPALPSPAVAPTVAAAAAPGSALQSPLAIPAATVATLPNMSIPERFDAERAGRPVGITPSVEDVYAELEKAGVKIVDRRQHLGSPFGARYCVGARALPSHAPPLHLSVCEFVNADAARAGRDYSAEGMKSIPLRTVQRNKQTTLTLREEKRDPATDALAEKAAAAYARL